MELGVVTLAQHRIAEHRIGLLKALKASGRFVCRQGSGVGVITLTQPAEGLAKLLA
jgi:hypothetical protein